MISRIQFIAWPDQEELARTMFLDAIERVRLSGCEAKLYITIEVKDQYRALRSKLAKRAKRKMSHR